MVNLNELLIASQLLSFTYREQWSLVNYYQESPLLKRQSLSEIPAILKELFPYKKTAFYRLNQDYLIDYCHLIEELAKSTISLEESDYPKLWLEMPQPPLLMYFKGQRSLLSQPKISIVGTRKMTSYGEKFVSDLVNACNLKGWVCVSGMAKGIDYQVHQVATNNLEGKTLGIIATGFHQCYPKDHQELQEKMMTQQLILSEYLPNIGPKKHHFIMRNRLVAGISPVTIVIEAAKKSGSLITANYALQFNREVFALPGNIDAIQSQGCNDLINIGARPIWDLVGVMEELEEIIGHYHEYF